MWITFPRIHNLILLCVSCNSTLFFCYFFFLWNVVLLTPQLLVLAKCRGREGAQVFNWFILMLIPRWTWYCNIGTSSSQIIPAYFIPFSSSYGTTSHEVLPNFSQYLNAFTYLILPILFHGGLTRKRNAAPRLKQRQRPDRNRCSCFEEQEWSLWINE